MASSPGHTAQFSDELASKNEEAAAQDATRDIPKQSVEPIAEAIDKLLHRARDIEESARVFFPQAVERAGKELKDIESILKDSEELLEVEDSSSKQVAIKNISNAIRRLSRLSQSQIPLVLQISLYLGLFSAYDAFSGELLREIYRKKPELFGRINRSIPVSEILQHASYEELKTTVLEAEIEAFRRKSYIEQFEDLEAAFGIKLKGFDRWPQFVECGQRRNLLTHCDGIVSEQYLKICSREGYGFSSAVTLGKRLELTPAYFFEACELIMEVAFKLGQTLWRKLFPDEIAQADGHLISVLYDCLQIEKWKRAQVFGAFAVGLKKWARDLDRRICVVNLAIAHKFGGDDDEATKLLQSEDWTAATGEFKLAEAVLMKRYDEAAVIMEKIRKRGDFLKESSYHEWPLFLKFRDTEQFSEAYAKVYGYPFAVQLHRKADEAQLVANQELKKQELAAESLSINITEQAQVHTETP